MQIKLIDFGYEHPPKRAHYNDAGADVYTTEDIYISRHKTVKLPLGFGIDLPDGFMALVVPRSGMSTQGLVSELSPIDSGYKGEIHAIVSNMNISEHFIPKGTRIAQLVIVPIVVAEFKNEMGEVRGENSFGSTGNK